MQTSLLADKLLSVPSQQVIHDAVPEDIVHLLKLQIETTLNLSYNMIRLMIQKISAASVRKLCRQRFDSCRSVNAVDVLFPRFEKYSEQFQRLP